MSLKSLKEQLEKVSRGPPVFKDLVELGSNMRHAKNILSKKKRLTFWSKNNKRQSKRRKSSKKNKSIKHKSILKNSNRYR